MGNSEVIVKERINRITSFIQSHAPKGVVVGISGGIDSAVVAKLCVEALGIEKVFGVLIIQSGFPYDHLQNARYFIRSIGIDHIEIDLSNIPDIILDRMGEREVTDQLLGDMKNRLRTVASYYLAERLSCRVVGTTNKSERLIGNVTKFGDSASDFMPLGDVYKNEVYEIAYEINIPSRIIQQPPSAGWDESTTDEDEIGMNYRQLDFILSKLEQGLSVSSIVKISDINEDTVLRISRRRVDKTHKFAPIPFPVMD